jgi:glycosyltransferase involved in cell wall biosynthesis
MSHILNPGLVSIVVASYNHARFLEQRIESLINQTYQNIEILVIDDCSPDNSVEILRRYESHPKVKLIIREKNGGWITVSNQGIEISSGEYVIFANCDDDCDPQMIERLVESISCNPTAGIAFCRSLMVDESDRVLGDDFEIRERSFRSMCATDTFIHRNAMTRFLLYSCVIPNLSAALIRRDCFDVAGLLSSKYKACSDWDLFFRIAENFDFSYVATPLNKFRQHSQTIRSATKGRIEYDEFFSVLLGEIPRSGLSLKERIRFRNHVMYLWAMELLRPSFTGWKNFPHHLTSVWRLDYLALTLLPFAITIRLVEIPSKLVNKLQRMWQDKIRQKAEASKDV